MTQYGLANFIRDNMDAILHAWEDFARTIEPSALTMSEEELRDHARNRGPVIPPDKFASIFDPLVRMAGNVQGDPANAEQTSLGLGLFIAREIIHAHGGHIVVASTAAEGTTFTITLPRRATGLRSTDPATGPYRVTN